ncbi:MULTISPECIES: divisome protein SepX/GlpR [unclassified Kribbella]|uniref:divisome protein SepX/GlpR n=1 Tax=unclassified Kribbella TaxID=2644121 RepID=UPI0030166DB3
MGTTGLIYVAIVAAWAAYLVPMLLKRNDEARRPPVASSDARVLARQGDPQSRSRYVVRPAGAGAAASGAAEEDLPPPAPRFVPNRARRVAAMRRRRVLSLLTLSLLSVTALAGLEILLWWTVAIPGSLIVAFVVLTRVQLRRHARDRARVAAERRTRAQARHDRGPAGKPAPSPDEEMTIEVKLPASAPEPVEKPRTDGLWDPVPVTLPTYVMKEKAPDRTVRTISLSDDEVFSSARTTDPAETPPVVESPAPATAEEPEIKRAVGD